jgi:DNA polymerase-3 subunit epsilon
MIKIFYDLETTGTDPNKNSIHQISGIIEVDDVVKETFDLKVRPHPKAHIDPAALKICNVTEEQILQYPDMKLALVDFEEILGKYINKFDPKDKAFNIGYNNRGFDDKFLRQWFRLCGNYFIGSWFWTDTIDVMVLASEYLMPIRHTMPSFKLKRVAQTLGIEVLEDSLHEALYDATLTREIYQIVTGRKLATNDELY